MVKVLLEIEGNKLLDGKAVAAHLVECCVLCVVSILLTFPVRIVE